MKTKLLTLLCCALTLVSALAQNSTKLRVTDPQRAQQLIAQGATLIADYGSFQILEAPPTVGKNVAGQADVASADEMNKIQLNATQLDTTTPSVKALRAPLAAFTGKRLHLVQFAGPIKPEWRDELEKRGARIVTHIPNNAYLIYGDNTALAKVQTWASSTVQVQWDGAYADAYKVHPRAKNTDAKGLYRDIGTETFAIQLVEDDEANAATLAVIGQSQLAAAKNDYKLLGYRTVIVDLRASALDTIAAQPDVVSIQPYYKHRKFDERQDQIMAGNLTGNSPSGPGYLAWLTGKGFSQAQFDASGFIVDVTDSGLDNGTTTPGHFALYKQGNPGFSSRVAYNRLEGTANAGSTLSGCDGHGNLNGHIIGGYADMPLNATHSDAGGFLYGMGVCPFVKLGSSVIFDPSTFTDPNYPNLQSKAYNNGARVSGNSWGADTSGAYDADAQTYDALVRDAQPSGSTFATTGNQQMVIVFAAGNAGPGTQTVGSPGTAKNIITVGAAENVRAFGGADGSGVDDSGANSANDMIDFSSRGPCADGRYKPDIVAPGTHITGGVGQSGSATTNGTGSALACYNAEGVSGGVGHASFIPSGQQFYTASSGTSHSTPGIAGACALVRQYFINASLTPPSPAMTKAFLVSSARYMTGTYANDTLPSQSQGLGHVNLGMAFDGVTRVLHDQTLGDKFTASGQTRTISGVITDNTKPFRVTLAWTDAPGSTTGAAYNNNLDLTVIVGGNTYKGNVFSGANSVTGGTADTKNNVESVFLPAGLSGPYTVIVSGTDINSDGVPNEAPSVDQDFALVIYNATEVPTPVIHGAGYALTNESCASANGVLDPNETVTVNFSLQNIGLANTTNVIATLLATGGVTSPSGPQSYGALNTNGAITTLPFTFTANGTCGSNVVATLALTDGTNDLGAVTYTLPLGLQVTMWSENFDGVSAPALPVGWSTTGAGGQTAWITTTSQSDSAPNAAYSTNGTTVGSNSLVSATITLPGSLSRLTFRNRYDLEAGFDGGVLEMKIGAGQFFDILANGGSFVSGGYNNVLDNTSGNPLGGRQAWSGNSGGFTTVIVNLPFSAAGQNVQFRWRCGSDQSVAGTGWWIDSVAVQAATCCGDIIAPIITTQPQSVSAPAGGSANFTVSAIGAAPLSYQWYFNSNVLSGATATNYFIPSVDATNVGAYFVVVTNESGRATSSVVTLTLATPPVITSNPASRTNAVGTTASFSVGVTGTAPLAYQWRFNATNIPSATTSNYSIASVTTNNGGDYTVVITNIAGAVTSTPATLTVTSIPPAAVVISQIYGGGGNSGATYQRDYIELYNRSGSPVSLNGWSVQYASSTGSGWTVTALQGTVQASSYYLISLGTSGGFGAVLPVAQATNSGLNISASAGKVALVNGISALTVANPVGSNIIGDFVGFGGANAYEGSGPAPGGGNTSATFRLGDGATDTDNNAADFNTGTPNPRTNAAPPALSVVDLAITKSHAGSFTQGDSNRTYTIVITNLGNVAATGSVSVVDTLPAGLVATAMSGAGWATNVGTLTATRADSLAAGASYPALTVTVNVATNAAALVTNSVTVSGGSDTNTVNNTAIDPTTIAAAGGGGSGTNTYSGVLVGWDMSGLTAYGSSPQAPTTNAPLLIVVAGLTRGSGVTTTPTAAPRAWGGNGFDSSTAAAAITANDYATLTVAATNGYQLSFTNISRFDYRRSGSGAASGLLQYQVGSGAFTDITTVSYSSSASAGASLAAIDLSAIPALQGVGAGTNVTFRLVNYGGTGGNWYIYDVANSTALDFTFQGSIAPLVPPTPPAPPADAPVISGAVITNGQFQFQLTGTVGSNYVVLTSTNLADTNWISIWTNPAPFTFVETNGTNFPLRFYRGRVQP